MKTISVLNKNKKFVDIIFHHSPKDHNYKAEIISDKNQNSESVFRTKITFNASSTLGSTVGRWVSSSYIGATNFDANEAVILTFKNDEPVELDLNKEIRNLQLSQAMRTKDMFLIEKKQKEKFSRKRKAIQSREVYNQHFWDSAHSGETLYLKCSAQFIILDDKDVVKNRYYGDLYFSNFRVKFLEAESGSADLSTESVLDPSVGIDIPLTMISSVEKSRATVEDEKHEKVRMYTITCKDFRKITFGWYERKNHWEYNYFGKNIAEQVVPNFSDRFCFYNCEWNIIEEDMWRLCTPKDELERQGFICGDIEGVEWTITSLSSSPSSFSSLSSKNSVNNEDVALPKFFVVPTAVAKNNSLMHASSLFRQKGRFPILTWGGWEHPTATGSVLLRAERPIHDETVSKDLIASDLEFLKAINASMNQKLETSRTPKAQQLLRAIENNQESEIHVIDIGTDNEFIKNHYKDFAISFIKVQPNSEIENRFSKLFDAVVNANEDWITHFEQSEWLQLIEDLLFHTNSICGFLQKKNKLVLIENGGSDYSSDGILVTLLQLVLDPYYRTTVGFCKLVDKEWVQYSFPFSSRIGNGPSQEDREKDRGKDKEKAREKAKEKAKEKDREKAKEKDPEKKKHHRLSRPSPVFTLFLNCVWELYQQNPMEFEFSEKLLLFLFDSLYDSRFGTFIEDSDEKRSKVTEGKTVSVWSHVLSPSNIENFRNPLFEPRSGGIPMEFACGRHFSASIWSGLFLRYNLHFKRLSKLLDDQSKKFAKRFKKDTPAGILDFSGTTGADSVSYEEGEGAFIVTKQIDLNNQTFSEISDRLSVMVLRNNLFTTIPQVIGTCTSLTKLNLDNNKIRHVSALIGKVVSLVSLSFKSNQISTLPDNLSRLSKLKVLHISKNNLSTLPSNFGNCSSLITLTLSHNNLRELPISMSGLENLKDSLDLSRNSLVKLPSKIVGAWKKLKSLNLAENRLISLPYTISNLRDLCTLTLNQNEISALPPTIGSCDSLVDLDISANHLKTLPEAFGNLRNLATCNISDNQLDALPASIGRLQNLKKLILNNNELTSLPLSIRLLEQLHTLSVQNNKLETLNAGIGQCKSLTYLDVQSNKLRELPATLGNLQGVLTKFNYDNNELSPHILQQGPHLLSYLKELLSGEEKVHRIKLMVIGQENVGKTTTIRALASGWEVDDKKKPVVTSPNINLSTDGIDIDNFYFYMDDQSPSPKLRSPRKNSTGHLESNSKKKTDKKPKKRKNDAPKVTVNVWDFAGQEIYYITHEFFLSLKCVYLILFNLAEPSTEARVEFWLQSLKARAPQSTVLIVGTHASDFLKSNTPEELSRKMEELKAKFKKSFGNLNIQSFAVDAVTQEGIPELRQKIQQTILKQKHLGEKYPVSYLMLERHLIEFRNSISPYFPIVSRNYVNTAAVTCGIKESERAIKFLHDIGSIIIFNNDPALKNFVILDPQWLTSMMATLFTTKHKWIKNGTLKHENLSQIWKNYPTEIHDVLLYLMRKFEISFEIPSELVDVITSGIPNSNILLTYQHSQSNPPKPSFTDESSFEDAPSAAESPVQIEKRKTSTKKKKPAPLEKAPSLSQQSSSIPLPVSLLLPPKKSPNNLSKQHSLSDTDSESDASTSSSRKHGHKRHSGNTEDNKHSLTNSISTSFPDASESSVVDVSNEDGILDSKSHSKNHADSIRKKPTKPKAQVVDTSKKKRDSDKRPRTHTHTGLGIQGTINSISALLSNNNNNNNNNSNNNSNNNNHQDEDDLDNYRNSNRNVVFTFSEHQVFEAPPRNPAGISLIPALLPAERPTAGISQHWSRFPQDHTVAPSTTTIVTHVDRSYHFSFMPKGLFSRLMVRMLTVNSNPLCLWHNGLLVKSRDSAWILIEQFLEEAKADESNGLIRPHPRNTLSIQIRSNSPEACYFNFSQVLETISDLLKEWVQVEYSRSVLSAVNFPKRNYSDPAILDIDMLEQLAMSGKMSVPFSSCTYNNNNNNNNNSDNPQPVGTNSKAGEESSGNSPEDLTPFHIVAPDLALVEYKGRIVTFSSLVIGKLLGKGGFAEVFLAEFEGGTVAVKQLEISRNRDASPIEKSNGFREFRNEILIQGKMRHPNVVNLYGICISPLCLVAEFVPFGNLYDFIHNYDHFYGYDMRIKIAEDLAKGLHYLHNEINPPIVHIDFKSPNIMMQSLVPTDPIVAKITDFGTSRNFLGIPISGRFVDNPVWLAPEVLAGIPYDTSVDTYALGVILWEILTRRNFFGEDPFNFSIEDKVLKGLRPPIGLCPKIYKELIESCWSGKREDRPSMTVVLQKLEILKKTENFSLYRDYDKQQHELLVKEVLEKERLEKEKQKQEEEEKQRRLLAEQEEQQKKNKIAQADWEAVLDGVEKPPEGLKIIKLKQTIEDQDEDSPLNISTEVGTDSNNNTSGENGKIKPKITAPIRRPHHIRRLSKGKDDDTEFQDDNSQSKRPRKSNENESITEEIPAARSPALLPFSVGNSTPSSGIQSSGNVHSVKAHSVSPKSSSNVPMKGNSSSFSPEKIRARNVLESFAGSPNSRSNDDFNTNSTKNSNSTSGKNSKQLKRSSTIFAEEDSPIREENHVTIDKDDEVFSFEKRRQFFEKSATTTHTLTRSSPGDESNNHSLRKSHKEKKLEHS